MMFTKCSRCQSSVLYFTANGPGLVPETGAPFLSQERNGLKDSTTPFIRSRNCISDNRLTFDKSKFLHRNVET